jgi:hypothetical protein
MTEGDPRAGKINHTNKRETDKKTGSGDHGPGFLTKRSRGCTVWVVST